MNQPYYRMSEKKKRKKIFQVPILFGKSCEDSFCPAEENSGHGLKYLMFQEGLCGDTGT